ncbi:hypothetical protein MBUL_02269 [Methylobacterium bullatum]|uniref:Group II intron-encoded protein LtrA n=1 Tax=Methylobacterium bullatum TaxID=570505 RepID=A0A679J4Z5_9HYPH|nr:hypothetical protein MBUL_02269 [Methylobacterium bullatum]
MTMQPAGRQMPARAGRSEREQGEALRTTGSDEAGGPRHSLGTMEPGLLEAALARQNLQRAWKRVRANKGAAGVDGLDIAQTAAHLRTAWPLIREQVLLQVLQPLLDPHFSPHSYGYRPGRLRGRAGDAGVIRLIRAYLGSGIMSGGVVRERGIGPTQGGPCPCCWPTCCSTKWTGSWNGAAITSCGMRTT